MLDEAILIYPLVYIPSFLGSKRKQRRGGYSDEGMVFPIVRVHDNYQRRDKEHCSVATRERWRQISGSLQLLACYAFQLTVNKAVAVDSLAYSNAYGGGEKGRCCDEGVILPVLATKVCFLWEESEKGVV